MKTLVTFLGLGHLLDRKDAGGCCWYQSADWSDDYKKRGMSMPHSVWRTLPHEGKTPDDRPGFEMSDLDSQYWVCKRLTSIQAWRNWFFKATQCKIWTCSTCQIRTMLNAVICSHDFIDWVVFFLQELEILLAMSGPKKLSEPVLLEIQCKWDSINLQGMHIRSMSACWCACLAAVEPASFLEGMKTKSRQNATWWRIKKLKVKSSRATPFSKCEMSVDVWCPICCYHLIRFAVCLFSRVIFFAAVLVEEI